MTVFGCEERGTKQHGKEVVLGARKEREGGGI